MPTIPWIPRNQGGPTGAVVMASRLEVVSLTSVPNFFLKSMVVWRQVLKSPGVLGVSLRAQPLARTFWTLSAWESREALNAFSHSDPHARIVAKLRPVTKDALFVFWETDSADLPASWEEAQRRLAEERDRVQV